MTDREKAKQRTQMLKELREVHKDTVASTQERLKNQKKIYRDINILYGLTEEKK
jgi:tetrahydromethanopterin S-methyltransferase subunit G